MTDEETILAQFGAIELVLTTICRMLPRHQRRTLEATVDLAEEMPMTNSLSDEARDFLLERARHIIGKD